MAQPFVYYVSYVLYLNWNLKKLSLSFLPNFHTLFNTRIKIPDSWKNKDQNQNRGDGYLFEDK